ncbi:lysophospholipid acyltransferase family protein [Falsigemmobacter faecalis]|uniref:1-acyl-sn-glycerol-3-phosphate acyltransferase n=1 Tax=Falsigemmobacter faecalis TaxID=2488730 RepID=A0A3P3DQQ1_9RHOB|nr:lysophospholipid acyltransferase family protein [Falsigemmobacter faecalis]RRH76593.1 1-acyl-sn-glycerol-3-phosphate acyltransferase [Falsigemmobacter faecalis]
MSPFWFSEEPEPQDHPLSAADWLRVVLRGVPIVLVIFGGLILLLLLRVIERPLFGLKRPVTPWLTRAVCRITLMIFGLRYSTHGRPMAGRGAIVANHAGWFDIFTLNAAQQIYFVSKDEVAGWPAIGWLARATGTVFIRRKGSDAMAQKNLFEARLRAGHRLLFFPEGTSTDSLRVIPFKSTLFAAFFTEGLKDVLSIQPVSLVYHAPKGEEPRFYGWWGEMEFGPSLLKYLAAPRHGRAEVIFHEPVRVQDFADRKALAAYCEAKVREGLAARQSP